MKNTQAQQQEKETPQYVIDRLKLYGFEHSGVKDPYNFIIFSDDPFENGALVTYCRRFGFDGPYMDRTIMFRHYGYGKYSLTVDPKENHPYMFFRGWISDDHFLESLLESILGEPYKQEEKQKDHNDAKRTTVL